MLNIHVINHHSFSPDTIQIELVSCSVREGVVYGLTGHNTVVTFGMIKGMAEKPSPTEHSFGIEYSKALKRELVFGSDGIYTMSGSLMQYTSPLKAVFLSPEGDLAFCQSEKDSFVFDLVKETTTPIVCPQPALHAAFRKDNSFIIISSADGITSFKNDGSKEGSHEIPSVTSLSWNPKGSWIAAGQASSICFFEKNCCTRQKYDLASDVISVSWSPDPDVLAVECSDNSVYILSTKNRVWHQKLHLNFESPVWLFWNESGSELQTVSQSGMLRIFTINRSVDSDSHSIYVIDGNKLLISNWAKSLIPPPLSHEKKEFSSDISCIASNGEKVAVFHGNEVTFYPEMTSLTLPCENVQCACWKDSLQFGSNSSLYTMSEGGFSVESKFDGFISLLSRRVVITDQTQVFVDDQLQHSSCKVVELGEDGQDIMILQEDGQLIFNGSSIAKEVSSVLLSEGLLAYISSKKTLTIRFKSQSRSREVEANANLLYFVPHIYSIVIQMERGNTEIIAPHVVVEPGVATLIEQSKYVDALQISRRYQITFSRFLELGKVSIPELTSQVPDNQLRPFISILSPKSKQTDKTFLLDFMSYILSAPVTIEASKVCLPQYDPSSPILLSFSVCVCICLVLFDDPVQSIAFACSLSSSQSVKAAVNFLLTLFDDDELFDFSLKTYDPKSIQAVGLLTNKEPSSYMSLLDELSKLHPDELRYARLDELVGDYSKALQHYSKCGPDYEETCLLLVQNHHFYELGLSLFQFQSQTWKKILSMYVEWLAKEKKSKELSRAVIRSGDESLILKHFGSIVDFGLWKVALSFIKEENYPAVKEALVKGGQFFEASQFCVSHLNDLKEAANLCLKCGKWLNAIQYGCPKEEVAECGFNTLKKELKKITNEALGIKKKYESTKEAQVLHPEYQKGKNKEKRGLPALVAKLQELLPSKEKTNEVEQVASLLEISGRSQDANSLKEIFGEAVKAIWPIPQLPEGEQALAPAHLSGLV